MQITQCSWQAEQGWQPELPQADTQPDWVIVFGARKLLEQKPELLQALRERFPATIFSGGSTAGEILGVRALDDTLTATFVKFESTKLASFSLPVGSPQESHALGVQLAQGLTHKGLRHVFVISDGLKVNGSELVTGLVATLPEDTTVTGGLCGDGPRFERSYVLDKQGDLASGRVSVVGFYGEQLQIGFGSLGGWDPFGPERIVTKSRENVLFSLDGKPALSLYKTYLGKFADQLPASGLRFPMRLRGSKGSPGVVRTILAVDEDKQCMIFAGDIPEGKPVRFMKANFDRLVDGAMDAASIAVKHTTVPVQLGLLVSCVGRKMVLGQQTEEELEAVADVLGQQAVLTGFYSYGEIAPFRISAECKLHNQTMTVTSLAEIPMTD